MKKAVELGALLLALFVLSAPSVKAQTTYNLPSTVVDYINYGGRYANLFADNMPITINGTPYNISITMHTDAQGNCISSCNIQFWISTRTLMSRLRAG